jgi:hypothetical protein
MCLKGNTFTHALESNNKKPASQSKSFSCRVRHQNLANRLILNLQQPLLMESLKEEQGLLLAR